MYFPETVIGKSVKIEPLRVLTETSALASAGRSIVILPFTVLNVTSPSQSVLPIEARIEPLTVLARATPFTDTLTLPLTVSALAPASSPSISMLPFTVRPTKLTPAGTPIVKVTVTSLFLAPRLPSEPGRHSLFWPG